ncbi:hypothetical protein A5768_11360 [Mycolicibacterium fortuitum]|uniref:hypothetical protein n=1 Tax=Mycolicibacterium fortuitum TaxID=1766 RepID=UPI0007EA2758|nr:hypothetical protein [Mycolicibacterium fortuitum]OBG11809.1 hypothetical protein A5768_11360 [Mycolicibacterium fortuitum]
MPAPDDVPNNSKRTTIFLDDDRKRRLKLAAINGDTTMNALIVTAVDEYFDRHPELVPAQR